MIFLRICESHKIYTAKSVFSSFAVRCRYREDVFSAGQIGGRCELDPAKLQAEGAHKSPLQSWSVLDIVFSDQCHLWLNFNGRGKNVILKF